MGKLAAVVAGILATVIVFIGGATASAEPASPNPSPTSSDVAISDVARPPGDTLETRVGGGALVGALLGGLAGLPFFVVGAIPGALIGAALGAGVGYIGYQISVPIYGP